VGDGRSVRKWSCRSWGFLYEVPEPVEGRRACTQSTGFSNQLDWRAMVSIRELLRRALLNQREFRPSRWLSSAARNERRVSKPSRANPTGSRNSVIECKLCLLRQAQEPRIEIITRDTKVHDKPDELRHGTRQRGTSSPRRCCFSKVPSEIYSRWLVCARTGFVNISTSTTSTGNNTIHPMSGRGPIP